MSIVNFNSSATTISRNSTTFTVIVLVLLMIAIIISWTVALMALMVRAFGGILQLARVILEAHIKEAWLKPCYVNFARNGASAQIGGF